MSALSMEILLMIRLNQAALIGGSQTGPRFRAMNCG